MKLKLLLLFLFATFTLHSYEKVVIWGYKLHSHTHSYIHEAFFRAFQYLGYDTYWFTDQDDVRSFDFKDSLFIVAAEEDKKIPLREDCDYVIHNCDQTKYRFLYEKGHAISLQVYTDDVLSRNAFKVDHCIYYDIPGKVVYMPWATNLLPHEIENVKALLPYIKKKKEVYWVGSMGGGQFGNDTELSPFKLACQRNGIKFIHIDPWSHPVSSEKNVELIQTSFLAPTIVGTWQKNVGYIPCRIFKNISYGQLGVTNSLRVYELFEGKIVYDPDTKELFKKACERLKTFTQEDLYELMDFVKTKHTYLNRIEVLLAFFKLVKEDSALK